MKNMKIVLLNPPSKHAEAIVRDTLYGCWCKGRASYMWPPLGLAYIGGVLDEDGHDLELIDGPAEGKSFEGVVREIDRISPEIVILNTATITFGEDLELTGLIKDAVTGVKTVHVGTHVTTYPKETLRYNAVDFVVIGEPEYTIRELVNTLEKGEDLRGVNGLGHKEKDSIVINPEREIIKNLDELPFPARHLYPDVEYFNPLAKNSPYTTALSSRGCPGKCIYCTSVLLYGKRYRLRSPDNVVAEMEYLKNQGINEVFFRDETFTATKKRVFEICNLIKEQDLDMTWMVNSRVDAITKEVAKAMADAGCHTIKFGVESGNQRILDNLKKGITLEQTKNAFKWTKEAGMKRVAHFMLGAPGDTKETVEETINFVIHELDPEYISPNITTPYPGTELFELVLEKGFKPGDDWSKWNLSDALEDAVFNEMFSELTKEELNEAFTKAYTEFYFRPKYLAKKAFEIRSFGELKSMLKAGTSLLKFVKDR
jgi:radical SAM superfamily enzyme YgiQ (UPF0313 family)